MNRKRTCLYCQSYVSGDPLSPEGTPTVCPPCLDEVLRDGRLREAEERLDWEENQKEGR